RARLRFCAKFIYPLAAPEYKRPMRRLFFVFALVGLNLISRAADPDPLWDNRGCVDDARGQWFRAAKFGAFIHFGLYSSLGGYYQGKGPYDPAEQIMGLGDRHQVI